MPCSSPFISPERIMSIVCRIDVKGPRRSWLITENNWSLVRFISYSSSFCWEISSFWAAISAFCCSKTVFSSFCRRIFLMMTITKIITQIANKFLTIKRRFPKIIVCSWSFISLCSLILSACFRFKWR